MTDGIAEILKRIDKLKTKNEKVEALRRDHNNALEVIIDLCFNPNIKFNLPEGKPPYKPLASANDAQSNLYSGLRRFDIYTNSGKYSNMKDLQREANFIQFIEGLDPDDAELVVSIKDKKMPYPTITAELFAEAWPTLASKWKVHGWMNK
jgi:hypothetical protein